MTTLLGELDKWVPMSPQRILNLNWTNDAIVAGLQGAPNESFDMWYVLKGKVDSVTCKIDRSGSGSLKVDGIKGIVSC